jgi:hypothetical protein
MAKIWTEEERKAFGEKMKASRAAKTNTPQPTEPVEATPSEPTVNLTQDQFQALMERLNKLETSKTESFDTKNEPQLNQLGRAVGIMQKYSVDPRDYLDPREQLYLLPELERFAFRQNYYLNWDVEQTQYETKYGTSFSEPRFELRLYKRLFEDDGEPTVIKDNVGQPVLDEQGKPQYKSYLVKKAFFFEDPAASMKEAQQLGIPVTNANSKEFLEQMRKLRYKSWLLEIFNRPKAVKTNRKEQMVIGSSVVEVESYSEVA